MAKKYIVAPGGCVQLPSGKVRRGSARPVLYQGEELPEGVFTPDQIAAHIKSGYVIVPDRASAPDPAALPVSKEDRPGESVGPPLTSGKQGEGAPGSEPVTTDQVAPQHGTPGNIPDVSDAGAGVVASPASIPGPVVDGAGSPVSKWIFDPATLEGKPLEELNVLIKENGPDVEPFETIEEALAWLSQDFNAG